MKNPDPSEQWRNLKETYSIMNDDELQAVANEAYDLTDTAKQALQSEISARGLTIQLQDKPSAAPDRASRRSELNMPEMTVVRRVWDISEAHEIQEFLLSAGVTSYLGPDNVEDVNDFHKSFDRGVDLKISSADEQLACRALARFKPSQDEDEQQTGLTEDDGKYDVRCPKCRSSEITFEGRDPAPPKDDGFYSKFNWTCEDCGHQWKDDGIEEKVG
jgi:Zn finger protein HypA/HybF involved in hydrogenase expression